MPDKPIGQQIIETGGFKRTAQEIFNAPSFTTATPSANDGVSFVDLVSKQADNKATSLSSVSQVQAGAIDISGRYPKQLIGADNEDLYAKGQTWGSKLWNDTKKMAGIAGATFAENTIGLLDGLGEWASTGDVSKLWDNQINNALNKWTAGLENSAPNYYSKAERDAPFFSSDNLLTPNFWFDKVMKNLGFSAGAMLGGMAWSTALKGIGLTGLLAKGGANMVETATGMEAAINAVPQAERTFAALDYLKDASKSLLKAGSAFNTTDKATRIVTAAFGTFGEASIEALNNANQFKQDRINEFKTANGYDPTGTDLDKINQDAAHVGNWSMGLNTVLLTGTNYIQFPKILNMSGKAEKSLLINGVETQGLRQTEAGIVESALPKAGFAKKLTQAKNIAGLFFNPTEAFEEGAQNVIQVGTQDFFKKQYEGKPTSFFSSLADATAKTLTSKEGLENILIGGLSGAIQTSGIATAGRTGEIKERGFTGYGGDKATATDKAIAELNDPTKSFGKSLKDMVASYNRAAVIQAQRETAIRQGDILESKDLERDYQFNYLMPRIKYGKLDFVLGDIERHKQLASTPEGYESLQKEGLANVDESKEQFISRLNNFEEHAKSVKESYDYLTNKYGANPNFRPEVVDRLAYNMSKIQNYDERIKDLSVDLSKKGVPVQDIINELHKGNPSEQTVKEAIKHIDDLNEVDSVKEDLKQQLQDVVEVGLRRTEFKNEYNQIIKTPQSFIDAAPTPTKQTNQPTVKLKTKTGEKDYEIGTEYMLGKVVEYDANGKEVYRFPKLTILGENEDGTIKIKTSSGEIRDIKKSELEDYKLSKVSDLESNKKAKFYFDHINDIFEFNFGKGKKQKGRLEYSSNEGVLLFTYRDKFGKTKSIEVTGDQFVAKQGFTQPMISKIGTLTAAQQKSLNDFASEKDARMNAKRSSRLAIIESIVNETGTRIDKVNKLLEERYNEFGRIVDELSKLENKIKAGELTKRNNFKATTNKAIKAANKLSRLKDELTREIQSLEAEKEEQEFNLEYFYDIAQNIDELPTDSKDFMDELKEQTSQIENLILSTGESINKISSIIDKVQSALENAIEFVRENIKLFQFNYPKAPQSIDNQEFVDFLKDNPNFLKLNPEYKADLRQLEEFVSQVEDLDINPNERTVHELRTELESLNKQLQDLEKEYKAKSVIMNKFEEIAKVFKQEQAEKDRIQNDKDLRAEFFKSTESLEKSDNEVISGDTEENKDDLKKIDITVIAQATTEPMYDATSEHNNAHRRHQEFLLGLSTNPKLQKLYEEGKIKILPVTAKTEEALGLKGIVNPQYKDTSIRYVYILDDSNGTLAYLDKEGNSIPATKDADLNKIIFTNARETDLSYTDKKGVRQPSYTNKPGLTDEELEEVEKQWSLWRDRMLTADITPENAIDNTFKFQASRGIPNVVNGSTRNSLMDIKVVTEEDLVNPLITIPAINTGTKETTIEVPIHNSSLKARMPLGKPLFNYNGNMFFLNNRNFTKEESESVAELIILASNQLKADGKIDAKLDKYLKSVIRFSKKAGRNIVHFDTNFNLHIGDNGRFIPIADVEKSKDIIATLLEKEMYHHISKDELNKFKENPSNTPYTELKSVKGKLTETEHKSYQHYLLLGKTPVLSTNIAIPQEGELPIVQKYAILDFDNVDVAGIISSRKAPEVVAAPAKKITSLTQIKASALLGNTQQAPALVQVNKKASIEKARQDALNDGATISGEAFIQGKSIDEIKKEINTKYDAQLSALETKPATAAELLAIKRAKKTEAAQPEVKPTTAQDLLNKKRKKFGNGNFNEPQTRLEGNTFTFTGDKAKELEDIKKMLPGVDIQMLKNMYQTTGGLRAWGYALPKLIALYEGAPFGVGYHEAFEQVFNWVLTPEQQIELYKEFTGRQGSFKTFNGEYKTFNSASFAEAKEQIADEFAEFKATGKIPFPKKNTSNFFKRLWEFIKSIFTNSASIEQVFNTLSSGGYANSNIQVQGNNEKQFKRDVTGVPEALFQDTISGFTAELFMKKWSDDSSLIAQLEDNSLEDTKPLFDKLHAGLERFYTEQGDNTLDAYYGKLVSENPQLEDVYIDEYEQVQQLWENVKAQWGNYMEDMKRFLKTFDVAFVTNEQGEIELASELKDEYEKLGGSDSYSSEDKMHVNAKNSASRAVKLLFATVADSSFVKEVTKNALKQVTESYALNPNGSLKLATNRAENQMKLPNLAPYAKLFNYTLHNSANTNGIKNIYTNLRAVAAKHNIGINANLTRLLNRLGYNGSFAGMSKESIKLVLKMENALSKTKPLFFKQYIHPKEGLINQASNISSRAEQIADEWVNSMKASKFVTVNKDQIKFKSTVINDNNFIFLSNLGISFTPSDYESLSAEDKNEFNTEISFIKAEIKGFTTKYVPATGNFGFSTRLAKLAELYTNNIEGDSTESQHANLGGEAYPNFILPNYVSFIINDLNATKTKEEFFAMNPQYQDLYMGSSHLLNGVIFDENGKRTKYKIDIALSEGVYSSKGDIIPHDKMSYSSRLLNEINNNINGIYTALIPADAKTPWGLKLGNQLSSSFFVDREKAMSGYMDIMWNTLLNEVALAKDFNNRKHIVSLNQKVKGREVGKSLRFFKGVLSEALVERINEKLIDSKEDLTAEQMDSFKKKFEEDLTRFITNQAAKTIYNLEQYRLIDKTKSGNFQLWGVDKTFMKKVGAGKYISNDKLGEIFFYREANYILNNIELHKLLFNDPAQYKDEVKRIKSFMSGREYTHSDKASDLNAALDKVYNKSGDYQMKPGDWGYKTHNNFFNTVTMKTVKTKSDEDYIYDNYKDNDIADAQSWVLDTTYMEQLVKSGARATAQQEKLHEWLMAYSRQKGLVKGKIKDSEYPVGLRNADNAILKQPIPDSSLQIIKPIITGTRLDENNTANQFLYKTSSAPLYLYFVEGTPMEEVYWDAIANNIHMIAMDSAHKVGQTKNNTVNWGDKLSSDISVPIDYKYFGIQVETGGTKHYQTQGSQLTKLATSGLMDKGEPINEEATKLIERHKNVLINLTLERSKKLLNKLDIKSGEFGYTIDDKRKIAKFILDEITRRELPDNIAVGIETDENNQFISPLEANVNYKKIKEILYSTIENNILKPKVNGGPKILLSSLGYDSVNINGKEVGTSRKYKFYQEKNGKYTCQIGIPFMFGTEILAQIEKSQGIKFASQKEGFKHVLEYLNTTEEGKDLLRGIGFRIPTQGLNSVDHFEIVEFLPPQMGDVTIFPAEITTKAGSDFDVDKMSIYLKNHYIDNNGYPKLLKYYGYSEEAKSKLSKDFVFESLSNLTKLTAKDKLKNYLNDEEIDDIDFEKSQIEEADIMDKMYLKSLENEYFSVLGDILSLKETRPLLLKPNDAGQLKKISQRVAPETEVAGDYTNFIDSDYMFKKRQLFLAMKSAVGIAAVSNTNLALNQYTNIIITPKVSDWVNHIERNFALRFPHNSVGKNGINLSHLKNTSDHFISDLGSQIIDGTVDVAKSEWLPKMLGDADNLNIILFMYKAGVDPYSAALFLNQPGVKEFVKQRDISNNTSMFNPKVKKQFPGTIKNEIIKKAGISKSQMSKFFKTKPDRYTNTEMESFLDVDYDSLTKEQKYLQMQMLDDFFMIKQLAGDLFTIVNGYNFDTSRFQNPESVDEKQLDLQAALELGNVTGQKDLLTKTHLSQTVKSVIGASEGISSALTIEKGNARIISNKFGLGVRTQFFKKDDRVKFRQMGKQSLTDYIINTQAQIEQQPIEKLSTGEFLGTSISDWVKAAQSKPSLTSNPMLQNIEAVIDQRGGYNSYLKLKEMDYDTFTSNVWTAALRELRDSGEIIEFNGKTRTVGNLFQHIMITQFLQNGTAKTRNSFLHLIPAEEFAKIVSPVLTNIQGDLNFWLKEGLFYRNNYQNSNIVTEAPKQYSSFENEETGEVNESYTVPKLEVKAVKDALEAKGYNSNILNLPAFGNANKQFIKTTEYIYDKDGNLTDKKINLYKRVDKSENEYLTVGTGFDTKVLFKQVNKLGNDNLKEYYSSSVKSILAENEDINEVSDKELYNFLRDANLNVQAKKTTELLSSDEYDLSLEDSNENVNLKPGKC